MRKLLAALAVGVVFAAGSASANPITYTLSGTFDVTVNGSEYDNLDITFTGIGDTSNVKTDIFPNTPYVTLSSFTASVDGYGSVSLPQTFDFFSNNDNGTQGFNVLTGSDFLDFAAFPTYDAISNVSPTAVTLNYRGSIDTPFGSGAVLTGSNLTFSAVVSDVSGAPEPGAWAMLLIGFFGLGSAVRRRAEAMA
jgi:hypothetical protein